MTQSILSATKERPILFSSEMVKALLDGQKTQTRRIVKPQPSGGDIITSDVFDKSLGPFVYWGMRAEGFEEEISCPCPYGVTGDRLWVKEAWAPFDDKECDPPEFVWYRADMSARNIQGERLDTYGMPEPKWKSSMFMPRVLSRITLEITDVRVERVQEISATDAVSEGVVLVKSANGLFYLHPDDKNRRTQLPQLAFEWLWDSINGKTPEKSWDANPWVWALTLKVLEAPCSQPSP